MCAPGGYVQEHQWEREWGERWFVWHVILFEEPNPTGSRPSNLIGLYKTTETREGGGGTAGAPLRRGQP